MRGVKQYGLEARLPEIAAEVGPTLDNAPPAAQCVPSSCPHAQCIPHAHAQLSVCGIFAIKSAAGALCVATAFVSMFWLAMASLLRFKPRSLLCIHK